MRLNSYFWQKWTSFCNGCGIVHYVSRDSACVHNVLYRFTKRGDIVREQDIYKHILAKLISQTENKQINDTDAMMRKLIQELQSYRMTSQN
ncbi:hypothetical protein CHH53_16440 [Terribacillus sp. 7520-G]|nr:hypothetical protein CHH53_16440 [Terribacillus sp. 7520-G]